MIVEGKPFEAGFAISIQSGGQPWRATFEVEYTHHYFIIILKT
jgi:hypothetical protein